MRSSGASRSPRAAAGSAKRSCSESSPSSGTSSRTANCCLPSLLLWRCRLRHHGLSLPSSASEPTTSCVRPRRCRRASGHVLSSPSSQRAESTAWSSTSRRTISTCPRSRSSSGHWTPSTARFCSSRTTAASSRAFALPGRWSCHPPGFRPLQPFLADEPVAQVVRKQPAPAEPPAQLPLGREHRCAHACEDELLDPPGAARGLGIGLVVAQQLQLVWLEPELRLQVLECRRARIGEVGKQRRPFLLPAHAFELGTADRVDERERLG